MVSEFAVAAIASFLSEFRQLGKRPDEPFVMINLLKFKEQASGQDFEGLSGEQAYRLYLRGMTRAQSEIGSRLIWAGRIQQQFIGNSEPTFEIVALLEYASPATFRQFARKPGDAGKARTAGLRGQWLLASTTVEENKAVEASTGTDPMTSQPPGNTGLSASELSRLQQGGANDTVFIVELLGFSDGSGERYQAYQQALSAAIAAVGGHRLWVGRIDSQVIGSASPSFDQLLVTRYPHRTAYLAALSDPAVTAQWHSRREGLALHWAYTATETQLGGFIPTESTH